MKKIFIIFILLTTCLLNINATEITLNDIATEIKKSDAYNSLGEIETSVTENTLILVLKDDEVEYSTIFNYENGVLSYTHPTDLPDVMISINHLHVAHIFKIVAHLNGYSDYEIDLIDEKLQGTHTLENNGIEMTLLNEGQLGISYFKIKLNDLDLDLSIGVTSHSTATIDIAEITKNSIKISIKTNNPDIDEMCRLYESTDGINYKYIISIGCNYVTYTYDNLQPNTKYYFKSVVEGALNFTETISATTLGENATNNIENPKTGDFFPTVGLILLLISCLLLLFYSSKINYFKKI